MVARKRASAAAISGGEISVADTLVETSPEAAIEVASRLRRFMSVSPFKGLFPLAGSAHKSIVVDNERRGKSPQKSPRAAEISIIVKQRLEWSHSRWKRHC